MNNNNNNSNNNIIIIKNNDKCSKWCPVDSTQGRFDTNRSQLDIYTS